MKIHISSTERNNNSRISVISLANRSWSTDISNYP